MNLETKRELIESFMKSITAHALKAAEKMPENWDGHEIRQWLADEFAREVSQVMRPSRSNARLKAYRNDVAVIGGL